MAVVVAGTLLWRTRSEVRRGRYLKSILGRDGIYKWREFEGEDRTALRIN